MIIFARAEPWGYGPISKLASVLNALRKYCEYEIYFYGTAWQIDFLRNNDLNFVIQPKYNPQRGQLVINCMDAKSAIHDCISGVNVVFIDSLWWFWPFWKEYGAEYYIHLIERIKMVDNFSLISPFLNPYDLHWCALLLATNTFLQDMPITVIEKRKLLANNSSHFIGPIVDVNLETYRYSIKCPNKRPVFLLNLGGCAQNKKYASIITPTVADAVHSHGFELKIAAGRARDELANTPLRKLLLPSKRKEIFEAMASANALISPPGLTFIMEAITLRKPIILLPPQHPAQEENAKIILKQNICVSRLSWNELFQTNIVNDLNNIVKLCNATKNNNYVVNNFLYFFDTTLKKSLNHNVSVPTLWTKNGTSLIVQKILELL